MFSEQVLKKIILRPGEEIETIIYRHWLSISWQLAIAAIVVVGSLFLIWPLFQYGMLGVSLFIALFFTGLLYGLREFLLWSSNIFIVTSFRVIDINRTGIFKKSVSELAYDKIVDVSYSSSGIIHSLMKLGTIKLKANSSANNFVIYVDTVKHPQKICHLITSVVDDFDPEMLKGNKVKIDPEKEREQAAKEFLGEWRDGEGENETYDEALKEYTSYDIDDVVHLYKKNFGEDELKKLLVDELSESGVTLKVMKGEPSRVKKEFKKKKLA